jgi:tetratricopeptide (TPR) repeat protein
MRTPRLPRPRALVLLLVLCGVLAADHGVRQPALDLWMQGRDEAAARAFEARKDDTLARLNALQIRALAFEQELATRPGLERARVLRGELKTHAQRILALKAGDKSLRFLVNHHGGRLLLAAHDSLAALVPLKAARDLQPGNQQTGRLLMAATERTGSAAALEAVARQQVKERPDNPFAWWYLGKALKRQNRGGEALEQWKRGIEVYPLKPMLEEAIRQAGRKDPARCRQWLEILARRYTHVYTDSSLAAFARGQGVENLLAGLPTMAQLKAREQKLYPQFFPAGRQWEYAVSFGIIPLGTLLVGVRGEEALPGGGKAMRVYYKIDSNPIYNMLIELHDEYDSLIPLHCLHSLEFNQLSRQGKDQYENRYRSDFRRGVLAVRGYRSTGDVQTQELPLAQEVFDGLSLLFAARRQVHEGSYGAVLTIIDEEMHRTLIASDGRGEVKLDDRRVPVKKVHGTADYQGIAGLTGEFWGSFTDDGNALPVEAKFQIGVGRITLRLKETRNR